MSSTRASQGFTLIEMIVSLTIIAAIMGMVYGSYTATTRSIDASRARTACMERAHFALRLMGRQIRCAYAPSTGSAAFHGDCRDPHGDVLSFVTSGGTGAGPGTPRGLARFTYRYDRATKTFSVSSSDYPGPRHDAPARRTSGTILCGVTSVELAFHDGRQWHQTWGLSRTQPLPRAVRVRIAVTDERGRQHDMRTTLPVVQQAHDESGGAGQVVAAEQP